MTKEQFLSFFDSGFTLPQEEVVELKKSDKSLIIGIPKEILLEEKRIGLSPDAASLLINNGHQIIMERGAGNSCSFSDQEYSEAGVKIVDTAEEAFNSDIIIKVSPPTLGEINMMKNGKTIISALQ